MGSAGLLRYGSVLALPGKGVHQQGENLAALLDKAVLDRFSGEGVGHFQLQPEHLAAQSQRFSGLALRAVYCFIIAQKYGQNSNVQLPVQKPAYTLGRALRCMVKVIPLIQLKHRLNSVSFIKSCHLFRILLDSFQNRIPGLAFSISQGKVQAIWPPLWFVGSNVLFHSGKPQ